MGGKLILSIDDVGDSVAFARGALRRHHVGLAEAESTEKAERMLSETKFDFIIADARLPVRGQLDFAAGPDLLTRLRRGDLGELNRETKCMLLTSYPDEVLGEEFATTNYLGLLSKADLTPEILGEFIDVDMSDPNLVGPDEVLDRQLVTVTKPYDPSDSFVTFHFADAEGLAAIHNLPITELPPEISFLYRNRSRPFRLYGTINLASDASINDRIRNLELPFD